MKGQQQGFTLIELVIVIVILGVLSAFALPRFADLGGDARGAAIEGAAGSIKSANSIVYSACLASSSCNQAAPSGETLTLEGQTVDIVYGYPDATTGGIQEAAQISDDDFTTTDSPFTAVIAGAANSSQCIVTFNAAASSTQPPTISTDTSGC